ncbi:MAG TPA: hypothetical protein VGH76_04685 [Actinomycetospora sp.]|uniref:hypothetical protein n=1 Tax=Actinomycetospora sp. TaxID=1872135 RepID=UPI002F40902E
MHVEPLAQRVVELIEGTAFTHLDSASVLSMLALLLAGAGLVTLTNFALDGGEQLSLLVAEPFPRVEASVGVVLAPYGVSTSLTERLRRYAEHPAVDGLVVATADPDVRLLPREIEGIPVRTAILLDSATDSVS